MQYSLLWMDLRQAGASDRQSDQISPSLLLLGEGVASPSRPSSDYLRCRVGSPDSAADRVSLYRPFRARPPLSAGHACRWTQNLRHRWHDISPHHCEVRRPAQLSCLCHHRCHRSHRAIVPSSAGCHPLSSLVATPPSFALHIPAFPLGTT